MTTCSKTVFIYCLKCPITGDVRYIGQTNNLKKRFQNHLNTSCKKKTYLGNWLRSLSEPPVLVVLHEVAENESWEEEERRYISCARAIGMRLVNATDGGEGASGYKPTPEQCAANSAAKKGIPTGPRSPETRVAISAALKGVPKSPEHCAAISAALTGVPLSPEHCASMRVPKPPRSSEHCAALSASTKGVPKSPERRATAIKQCVAMSAAKTGVPHSPEHCAAIRAALMGVPLSPEHSAAISAAKTGVPWSPARRAVYEAGKRVKAGPEAPPSKSRLYQ